MGNRIPMNSFSQNNLVSPFNHNLFSKEQKKENLSSEEQRGGG